MTHPVRLLSALACALLACAPDPTTPGSPDATFEPVQVWIDPAWSPANAARIADELTALHRLGPADGTTLT
jgi:hypothetical protein